MPKRAQSTIEFSIGFVLTILFVMLTFNLFVWFNNCLVRRQRAYEDTRVEAGRGNPGRTDFYRPPRLNIFRSGGR